MGYNVNEITSYRKTGACGTSRSVNVYTMEPKMPIVLGDGADTW